MITNEQVTAIVQNVFQDSKTAGNDDGVAYESVIETIREMVGDRTGSLDQETMTWTFDENEQCVKERFVHYEVQMDSDGETVHIYNNEGVWLGTGRWNNRLDQCAADLGDDVYDAIDDVIGDAITDGNWGNGTGETAPSRAYSCMVKVTCRSYG